jgi:hypothetical protein
MDLLYVFNSCLCVVTGTSMVARCRLASAWCVYVALCVAWAAVPPRDAKHVFIEEAEIPCNRWQQCTNVPAFKKEIISAMEARAEAPFESNGCGSAGFQLRVDAELEQCCDAHDACYSVCNVTRSYCDDQMRRCLKLKCSMGGAPANCGQTAAMLSLGADRMGCNAFQSTQKDYCDCVSPAEAAQRTEDFWLAAYSGPLGRVAKKSPAQVREMVAKVLQSSNPSGRISQLAEKYAKSMMRRSSTSGGSTVVFGDKGDYGSAEL